MDKNQLDEYKREMMKLYGKSRSRAGEDEVTEPVNDNMDVPEQGFQHTVSPEIEDVDPDAPDDTAWSEFVDDNNNEADTEDIPDNNVNDEIRDDTESDVEERFPSPDLSSIEQMTDNNEPATEEDLGDSSGFILVNVRTGDESWAIEGAVVMISAIINGSRLMIATGIADSSGTTRLFEVPVPDLGHSQQPFPDIRPYTLYDITVTAKGFFNARSVDVPVFPGITSIQNFSMIPVPLQMNESDETLTIYNQEPYFGSQDGRGE